MAAGPGAGDFIIAPTVVGIADGRGSLEPLVGVVEFRPRQSALPTPDGIEYTGPVVVELDADGRIPDGTRVPGWPGSTCQVVPRLRRGEHGRDLRLVPFDVPAEPGSTVFLSDHLTMWTDPSAGTVYVRGPRGEFAVEDREFFTSVRADVLSGVDSAAESASRAEGAATTAESSAGAAEGSRVAAESASSAAQAAQAAAQSSAANASAAGTSAASSASVAGSAATEAALSRDAAGGFADSAAADASDAASAAAAAAGSASAADGAVASAAGHVDVAAGAASDAQQSADAASASASAADERATAAQQSADAASASASTADERASAAQQSAASAASEHSALTAAIAAGDYRGVGIEAVENEPGSDTATVRYTDGNTSALPLPPGPPPLAEWDGAHLVVGGQRSPDLTGPQSLVPGPPGAVPTAADYAIVGPGRPDVPASTGDLVSASTPVGATYTSTDGAGVGAFVWRKRPDGSWVVIDGNTGWRNVEVRGGSEGTVRALRAGNTVAVQTNITAWGAAHQTLQLPLGLRPDMAGANTNISGWTFFANGAADRPASGAQMSASFLFTTADAWPNTLPSIWTP